VVVQLIIYLSFSIPSKDIVVSVPTEPSPGFVDEFAALLELFLQGHVSRMGVMLLAHCLVVVESTAPVHRLIPDLRRNIDQSIRCRSPNSILFE